MHNRLYNQTSLLTSYRNNFNLKNINTSNNTSIRNTKATNTSTISKSVEKYFLGGLEELKFNNNVLNIKNGVNYKVKSLTSGYSEVVLKNNRVNKLFNEIYPNVDDSDIFSNQEIEDMGRTNQLIDLLASNHPFNEKIDLLRIFYPQSLELKARLESLGDEAGKPIQFNGCSEKVLFETNGWLYTQKELDGLRNGYNRTNFFQFGYTQNSKFLIDGKEFKLDETGHLNIPEGTICTPTRAQLIK